MIPAAAHLDENSGRDVGLVTDALDQIRKATDGGVALGVAHTPLSDRGRVRGHSAWEADVDTVYIVEPIGEGSFGLHREKRKDGPREDRLNLELKQTMQSCVVQNGATNLVAEGAENAALCDQAIRTRFDILGASRAELEEATGLSKSSVTYALNVLLKADPPRIRREGKGHATRYFPDVD